MPGALDPNKFPTLLDVAKLDKGSGYDVIQEAIHSHVELDLIPTRTQADTDLEVTVMTELPDGETFRRPNEGILPSKPKFTTKKFPMALVDRRVEIDKYGVADKSKDKARLRVNLSVPQMNAALRDIAKQIIYGRLDDPNKGFPGLVAQAANDDQHAVNVAGASNRSSVWFLELVPSAIELVFGEGQTITMGDEWDEETIFIQNPDKLSELRRLRVEFNQIHGWAGLRLLNIHRAIQIKNIGTAAGQTLTHAHMVAALNKAQDELGFRPTHILGHGRSFEQLRQTNATDLLPNPPRLTEYDGIPVVRSINISQNEAAR